MSESFSRPEVQIIYTFGPSEEVLGMRSYRDMIIIATSKGVYACKDGKIDAIDLMNFQIERIK